MSTLTNKRECTVTQQFADYFTKGSWMNVLPVISGFFVVTFGFQADDKFKDQLQQRDVSYAIGLTTVVGNACA